MTKAQRREHKSGNQMRRARMLHRYYKLEGDKPGFIQKGGPRARTNH